jgi:large subunit ribosomal protein L10
MPPRIPIRPRALLCARCPHPTTSSPLRAAASYASIATASATTPAPPIHQTTRSVPPVLRYPPTQPPSHKPPEVRKTQLHRQYQSLLRSSPLILIFQHNNVKAVELMSIRRELAVALGKVDAERAKNGQDTLADEVKLQIIQTNIFASALRVVEFFNPESDMLEHAQHPSDPRTPTSARIPQTSNDAEDERFTHGLSRRAHEIANNRKLKLDLEPLLSGPLAVVAFPSVTPQYLKAVLSVLSPSKGDFPAPTRRANPDYYEPAVQQGLQKLMLLGARVEGKVFDVDGTKWVGGIDGGLDGLRAQLVHMLQGVGGSLTNAIEGASKSLYFTMEGRRMDMEEKEKGPTEQKE